MGLSSAALRIFKRDLLSGNLNMLLGALILAVTAISTTGILANRLDRTVGAEAGEIPIGPGRQAKAHPPELTAPH